MYSLGEIETQCKKASKGVGLTWGLAEEAGLIARHLSEFNLPGSDTIFINLKFTEDNGWPDYLASIESLDKGGEPINGLLLGIMILDQVSDLVGHDTSFSESVVGPLAVVGALLRLQNERYFFSISWQNCNIRMNGDGFSVEGTNLNPQIVNDFTLSIFRSSIKPVFEKEKNKRLPIKCWDFLTKMANKTYVPESTQSRLLGAGAGERENE